MRSMPWLDADLAQSRALDSGESPSCFFRLFMVTFMFLFLFEPLDWQWLMTILVSLSGKYLKFLRLCNTDFLYLFLSLNGVNQ